ncbi:DUF4158 domain-containing protein [Streptomyces sp. ME19-01-6]|nr:DUF4158 domain-containing protein [Streptomyces sp. ME19-01-6]MDX3225444.1 DUF4158 domain-containing protein [Streptomyces sp. ME19-01-6]
MCRGRWWSTWPGSWASRTPRVCQRYTDRRQTVYDHAREIRDAYGYHQYEDHDRGRKFRAFLHGRAWTAHAEGPKALFDHAVGWLRRHRVPLPGVSVLAPAGRPGPRHRGPAAAHNGRQGGPAGGCGAARGPGGNAEDAGGQAVFGAGADQ